MGGRVLLPRILPLLHSREDHPRIAVAAAAKSCEAARRQALAVGVGGRRWRQALAAGAGGRRGSMMTRKPRRARATLALACTLAG